jgi:hypothetical protein
VLRVLLGALALIVSASGTAAARTPPACTALALARIAPAGVTILAAKTVPANGTLPAHCLVDANVATPGNVVDFRLGLPASWNQKLLFNGVGGFGG